MNSLLVPHDFLTDFRYRWLCSSFPWRFCIPITKMSDLYSAAQYLLFVIIITIFVKPLGGYLERVFAGRPTLLDRSCLPIERLIYRLTGTDPAVEMTFGEYATSF